MRFALECQADIWRALLLEDIDNGELWVESNRSFLTFISSEQARGQPEKEKGVRRALCGEDVQIGTKGR